MAAAASWHIAVVSARCAALARWSQALSLSPARRALVLGTGRGLALLLRAEHSDGSAVPASLVLWVAGPVARRYWAISESGSALERLMFLKRLLVVGVLLPAVAAWCSLGGSTQAEAAQ